MPEELSLEPVSFQDWDSLAAAVARLREEGWTVVERDVPEAGVRGFAAGRDGERGRWLRCPGWRSRTGRRGTAPPPVCIPLRDGTQDFRTTAFPPGRFSQTDQSSPFLIAGGLTGRGWTGMIGPL